MMQANPGAALSRHHHITLCAGGAQEDYDFHTRVLGLKSVKKTLLYDGNVPIYHLYYGNDMGEESSLLTSFPVGHTGVKARHGSGQIADVSLSVPVDSLPWWQARLRSHGFEVTESERFGEPCLLFKHPCGIDYVMTGVAVDQRAPFSRGPVSAECRIRGTHAITASVRDADEMDEFLLQGWGARRIAEEGNRVRYALGAGASGTLVDLRIDPGLKQGSWNLGEGAIHHMAFQVGTHAEQAAIKANLESMGLTDTSDVKDRGYFDSIYVRTPGGVLFEATVSHDDGFTCDEPADRLGHEVMVSPQFSESREALVAQLGVLKD